MNVFAKFGRALCRLVPDDPKNQAALSFGIAVVLVRLDSLPPVMTAVAVAGVVAAGTHAVLEVMEGEKETPRHPDENTVPVKKPGFPEPK